MNFKPLLAQTVTIEQLDNLKYPIMIQPKLDGIRCCLLEGRALSRTLKPIPNHYIRNCLRETYNRLSNYLLDGELVLKDKTKTFQEIQSAIMTQTGTPDFEFIVFDGASENKDLKRDYTFRQPKFTGNPAIKKIYEVPCYCKDDILAMHQHNMTLGYEGSIIRGMFGSYKFGRSTLKEQYLLKLKDFEDAEAVVIGFEEKLINDNDPELDKRGYTKRSSSKSGMISGNTLGALIVKGINGQFEGVIFNVGSGFTHEQRSNFWNNRNELIPKTIYGKTLTYKYQRIGSKDKPREPIFKGFRNE